MQHRGSAGKRFPPVRRSATAPFEWGMSGGSEFFRIGLAVPMCGAAGLWGPSSIASAQLAVAEINEQGGIGGREASLVLVDAAEEVAAEAVSVTDSLIENGEIDAIVGMHISAMRQRLAHLVAGRVPYIYTPLYEGNENTPGVFAIGETSDGEIQPAIRRISELHRVRRWALIGNDYVWPRVAHDFARTALQQCGGDLVMERFLPFGSRALRRAVTDLAGSGAEAVLVSLIGQDAVDFHRCFGALDLDRRIIRLTSAFEENALLATGGRNAKRLYAVASYFGALQTHENQSFREKYHALHGDRAPMLNALGQSIYEGTHFLHALARREGVGRETLSGKRLAPLPYKSARRAIYAGNSGRKAAAYLARADGHLFDVLERLG